MTPDMSAHAMLDQFIFIVKGSRVIDRKATDWRQFVWLDDRLVKHHVYSLAEMRAYFRHRIKRRMSYGKHVGTDDPFGSWMTHPHRFTEPTLSAAMQFADKAARGEVEPRVDLDEMIRGAIARIGSSPCPWQQPRQLTLPEQLIKATTAHDAALRKIERPSSIYAT